MTTSGVLGGNFVGIVTELSVSMAQDRSKAVETIMISCALPLHV